MMPIPYLKNNSNVKENFSDNLVMSRYQNFMTFSHAKEEIFRKIIQRFILSRARGYFIEQENILVIILRSNTYI